MKIVHYLAALLVILIGISAAASDKNPDQKKYSFSEIGLDPAIIPSDDKAKVIIKDGSFRPSKITVAVGARVEWHNQDDMQHTVVSDDGDSLQFSSGLIMPGKKFSSTFNTPGVYGYHCSIQQDMRGKITVVADDIAVKGAEKAAFSPSWSQLPMSGYQRPAKAPASTESIPAGQAFQMQINPAVSILPAQSSGQITAGEASRQIDLQKFSPYYSLDSSESGMELTSPAEIDLDEASPQMIYFGASQKAVPYSQYQSYATSTGSNSLWISGSSSWTQYAAVPIGSHLDLIAITPGGGYGHLYQIYPDETLDSSAHSFYPYNSIHFYAGQPGEHQLFFNIDGQPSNVIVIDVVPYQQVEPSYNLATITIRSTWLRGYNLYVDGSYMATEGTTGDEDGVLTINVPGDQSHNIAIDGSGMTFSDIKFFQAGYGYQLNI